MALPRLSDIHISIPNETENRVGSALVYIEHTMTSRNFNSLIEQVCQYPYKILIRICQRSPRFEKFCRSNIELQKKMTTILNAAGQPGIALKSMDGLKRYQIFDLYLAASFMNHFGVRHSRSERISAMTYACYLGLNDALVSRCLIDEKSLKNQNLSDDEMEKIIKNLLDNLHELSNLYWGFGCIQAACILNTIAFYFKNVGNNKRASFFYEKSVFYFLFAFALKNITFSNELIKKLSKSADLQEYLKEKKLPFLSEDDAKEIFCEWIGSRYQDIEAQVKKEISFVFNSLS